MLIGFFLKSIYNVIILVYLKDFFVYFFIYLYRLIYILVFVFIVFINLF